APIAVAFAVLDLTGSASDTGIAFACWTLAQVSTLIVGGVVADRLPRRLVMVGSDAGNVCVRTAMGVLLISGHAQIWEIFVLQALGGAATAFYSPASSGLVPELVGAAELQQANAFMGIARYLAFPLGAATGGAIVATIGSSTALLVDGGTYAASALLLSGIRLPARVRAARPSVGDARPRVHAHVRAKRLARRAGLLRRDRLGGVRRGVLVLARLDHLRDRHPACDRAGEAQPRQCVQLDVRDGLPPARLRARRPNRRGRGNVRGPGIRRRVDRCHNCGRVHGPGCSKLPLAGGRDRGLVSSNVV